MDGELTVNQSSLTGESVPVPKAAGGYVYAGTVVEEGTAAVRVTRSSGTGKYDRIVKMIEESEKLKSSTEAKAFHLADSLVPYSFAGALITFLLTRNVQRAMSFLMVDFSCALKLSMPLSVLSSIREASEQNISVKGGRFLENYSEAKTILFDSLPDEYSHLYLASGGELIAVLLIADPIQEDAVRIVEQLHALGVEKICMMTGDSCRTASSALLHNGSTILTGLKSMTPLLKD